MATVELQQFKVTALPTTLVANAIYYVSSFLTPTLVDIYVVDALGAATKHTLNTTDVNALINSALATNQQLSIVSNIAERNLLTPIKPVWVYVEDATADTSVASGGATYLYNPAAFNWVKASEAESLDIALNWASLQNKPVASVSAIDAAVVASHTHDNLLALAAVTTPLKSPSFTYTLGKVSSIVYSDGSTKTFTYAGNLLIKVDLLRNGVTTRKVFTYSGTTLINVVESVL